MHKYTPSRGSQNCEFPGREERTQDQESGHQVPAPVLSLMLMWPWARTAAMEVTHGSLFKKGLATQLQGAVWQSGAVAPSGSASNLWCFSWAVPDQRLSMARVWGPSHFYSTWNSSNGQSVPWGSPPLSDMHCGLRLSLPQVPLPPLFLS